MTLLVAGMGAGCVNGTVDEPVEAQAVDGVDTEPLGIETEVLEGMIMGSVATPAISFNYGGAFSFPFKFGGNVTGVVLELEWDSAAPTNDELDLWVRAAGEGSIPPSDPTDPAPAAPIAKATGPSMLRLALAAADFPEAGDYELLVRAPGPGGAAANQPFHLHVTTFTDVEFDADYTSHDH